MNMALTGPYRLVWDGIVAIGKKQKLKRISDAVTNNFHGALITGGAALIGGLLGGKTGMALGGLVGGVVGATSCQVESVVSILNDLSYDEKRELVECLHKEVGGMMTLETLARMIFSSADVKIAALQLIEQIVQRKGYEILN